MVLSKVTVSGTISSGTIYSSCLDPCFAYFARVRFPQIRPLPLLSSLARDEGTPILRGSSVEPPGDDGGSPVLEDDAEGVPVSWAFRPPVSLRSGPESGGSCSNNSRNSRRRLAGSPICRSCWKFAQIRRWICSRRSNRSYAWNTMFSSNHIVGSEKLGFTMSNSDLSTGTISAM